MFWRAERARKNFGFWHLKHADKWVLGNYWRQIIFFTVPLSKIIFFSQNQSKEIFFEKNPSPPPPPRISNGPCLISIGVGYCVPVYSTCLVLVITMAGLCRLQKGCVKDSKNKKIKTKVTRYNYTKKEIKICSWIYQWCDAVCIIRRYYCESRDVIWGNTFIPELRLFTFHDGSHKPYCRC